MKIGIIAGNRNLPVLLAKRLAQSNDFKEIAGIGFKGETRRNFCRYVDSCAWVEPVKLGSLRQVLKNQGIQKWIMAGQINPLRVFNQKKWDKEMTRLVKGEVNFCPHVIFTAIINYLEEEGVEFLDSTRYFKPDLAEAGVMNHLRLNPEAAQDVKFGLRKVSQFVELDIGQVLVVKNRAVAAAESLEGTDNTIKRGFKLAGKRVSVFKFARKNQDLRFDVPVVGLSTLQLLKKIKASALVLQKNKVIILEKDKFLRLSREEKIPVIGV